MRFSRMIGADASQVNMRDAVLMAQAVAEAQVARLGAAVRSIVERLGGEPETVILSGEGEFLAKRVLTALDLQPTIVSLAQRLGGSVSKAAPAHALAVLARENTASGELPRSTIR